MRGCWWVVDGRELLLTYMPGVTNQNRDDDNWHVWWRQATSEANHSLGVTTQAGWRQTEWQRENVGDKLTDGGVAYTLHFS